MSQQVKLSIQLPHGDGFRIQYKRVHLFIRGSCRRVFALQCCESLLQNLVTLRTREMENKREEV